MKKVILISILVTLFLPISAQTYFKDFKAGESNFQQKKYVDAIENFTKVIEAKKDHDRAFNLRGLCYFELKDYAKAVADFTQASSIKEKEAEYHFNLGKANIELKDYPNAIAAFDKAIDRDKKMTEAYHLKIKAQMEAKMFMDAVSTGEKILSIDKNATSYYLLGVAQDSSNLFKEAANSFDRAKFYDSKLVGAYIGLGHTNMKLQKFTEALQFIDKALTFDNKNIDALLVRSEINVASNNLQAAIDDISKIIVFEPELINHYINRAALYEKIGQNSNAIEDYTKGLSMQKENASLYFKRAALYEKMADFKAAIKDYNEIKKLSPYDGTAMKLYDEAKKRMYELNRESDNPEIVMIAPLSPKKGFLQLAKGTQKLTFKGSVKDASLIEFVKVNGKDAHFSKDSLNPIFELEVDVASVKNISITVFDVYQNSETWNFEFLETEINAPVVNLFAPYASDDGTIQLDTDDPSLYIEGVVKDESFIKSIFIDGVTASFNTQMKNPKFSMTINIMNKTSFIISTEDEYGNKTEKTFILNRENVALLADNPMGKTWVIFIENSQYQSFASLDGPGKDVTMMKSAFAKYKINNVVHKKDMTKSQLERFFSIELRDLVRSNKVNSLLVWYAGHGKFINETGYWIPTDAKRDDEFTYFNINNLKASMQSYSKEITHTLVITDACESGPSFYQAMRSTPTEKSCNDWKATKFKSSQVFSSAGYELASDNSQFTKTFASTLSGNPDACIPIETIVTKVKTAVTQSGAKQAPKFGKIAGLEDEDGTFFFIKK